MFSNQKLSKSENSVFMNLNTGQMRFIRLYFNISTKKQNIEIN